MEIEILTKLEEKIDQLISQLETIKNENQNLVNENKEKSEKVSILEKENSEIKSQLENSEQSGVRNEENIQKATEIVKRVLGKLESY